jgi:TolB protein
MTLTRVFFAVSLLLGSVSMGRAEETAGLPTIVVEDFMGGTGRTAANLLRVRLEQSERFLLPETANPAAPSWQLRASSSAGRVDGALLSTKGDVVFSRHYRSGDMVDNVNAFADDIVEAISGEPGIASSRLAFVSDASGAQEIYTCDSDGKRLRQITNDRTRSVSPALSPGGIYLAHTSYRSGFADVYLTDLTDGMRRRIINAPGTNSGVTFSHDGTRLALTMSHEGDPDIYITLIGGGSVRRLTESKSVEFSPAWAPDDQRLVFCSDATGSPQLYICRRNGSSPERLETGFAEATSPDWSPDGKFIAFTARNGRQKSVALFDIETGKSRVIATGCEDPVWSPDSRHLAMVQSGDLTIYHLQSGKRDRIVTRRGTISEPTWSK